MSALPMHPTECDRERFRDWTKAMQFGLEYDRHGDDYKYVLTDLVFRLWWAVERERQLLQNLNMSQGCKMSELAQKLEKAEAELAKLREQTAVAQVEVMHGFNRRTTNWLKTLPDGTHLLYAAPVPAVAAPSVPEEWLESTKAMLLSLDEAIRAGNAVYVRQEDKVANHRHCWMRFHEKRQVVDALLQSAPQAPAEWREVMTELADDLAIEIDQSYPPERRAYPSEQRRYKGEMEIVNRARALLQSTTQSDKEV